MEKHRQKEQAITLICLGVSGIALVLGFWVAASPLRRPQ